MVVLSLTRKQATSCIHSYDQQVQFFFPVWAGSEVVRPRRSKCSHTLGCGKVPITMKTQGLRQTPAYSRPLEELEAAGAEKVYREPTEGHAAEMISSGVLCRNDI